ncbi:MAG TPA: TetR/AcrR family transcriptional regulator [Armatimonadota bacterium]|nr:TetR/AcrR family transcriptional regulator [Armatimonadota bacterium]
MESQQGSGVPGMAEAAVESASAEAREGRVQRRTRETRRRILRAALELFSERGFEGVTVEEIAERADVARGTVFNHFSTKESLCEGLGELQIELIQEAVQSGEISGRSAGEKIAAVIRMMAEFPGRNPESCRALLTRALTCMKPGELSGASEKLFALLQGWVAEGQSNGEFRADVAPCELTGFIMGLRFQATLIWAYGFVEYSLADYTERVLRLALEGIQTRPQTV